MKTVQELQAEVDEKIRLGILPKGAVVAVCSTPGCKHWAHGLEENAIGIVQNPNAGRMIGITE